MSQPILFTPLTIRGVTIPNRVVIPPMDMYCAEDGHVTDFHRTHYGKFAFGGAGLIFVEAAAVTRTGRISNGCTGIYHDSHVEAFRPITAQIRGLGFRSCLQLAHAGRKAATQRAWEGNGPLTQENLEAGDESWTPIAPSAVAFTEGWLEPREMDRADMDEVREAFVTGAQRALEAGFDMVEIHMAHGYLLQSFLTPLANRREDAYGGSLENRMRYPLEVVRAVRAALPDDVPLFTRISATDWIDGGWEPGDSVALAKALKQAGVDVVDCSSGGNMLHGATNSNLARGPAYQAQFAKLLREETGIMTQAVGLIRTPDLAEQLLQEGQADLIAIGRQSLFNPYWAHHAAERLGVPDWEAWPAPYAWWLSRWKRGLASMDEEPLA
ncbi:putative FMN oxidoreductase [Pseudooceanicola batsensis HTCC2597]|uniref:Putative FMN oxidoreductase n=1 Tax=Pseudooceanicola batsensis (strain ATCC BAA-863 / DSM 15984 / KCTC 12145 / HTCC2597) TaxID=252305 RepID=A3TSX7_PSEBH|nr:NADH:flavin oxidoreductase/NADH oxidase [Pseudooceanicola batsensis]EAQ04754.1 putative FMN oxidoreductase [Pseudooceanicola batsensis HTCC2597]